MAANHLIRWGAPAFVSAFASAEAVRYPRGSRVVVRTSRGLEVGEVLAPLGDGPTPPVEGQVIRSMTEQDRLLETRLLKNRAAAYDACSRKIADAGLDAVLMDVEHLFDGQSLIFYFLGDEPPQLESLGDELAAAYDAQVQFRAFADAVVAGCGPDCGTEDGAGCGSCSTGGCGTLSGCAVADYCSSHGRSPN